MSGREILAITDDHVGAPRQIVARHITDIDAAHVRDARVGLDPLIELPVSDIESDDPGGAAPQQHLGESPG